MVTDTPERNAGLHGDNEQYKQWVLRLVGSFFLVAILLQFKALRFDVHDKTESGHDRIEIRNVWCTDEVHHLKGTGQWKGIKTVAVVETRRKVRETPGRVSATGRLSNGGTISAVPPDAIRCIWLNAFGCTGE